MERSIDLKLNQGSGFLASVTTTPRERERSGEAERRITTAIGAIYNIEVTEKPFKSIVNPQNATHLVARNYISIDCSLDFSCYIGTVTKYSQVWGLRVPDPLLASHLHMGSDLGPPRLIESNYEFIAWNWQDRH